MQETKVFEEKVGDITYLLQYLPHPEGCSFHIHECSPHATSSITGLKIEDAEDHIATDWPDAIRRHALIALTMFTLSVSV